MNPSPVPPVFAYGFRPFFLAMGVSGLAVVPAWLFLFLGGVPALGTMPAYLWHGHEMLFGFAAAAIAGFLLTAVPSWTGGRGFAGMPLMTLTAVWLVGRLAFAWAGTLPLGLIAAVELAFLPGLALLIGPPILRARDRNRAMLGILAALWVADGVFLLALARQAPGLASQALLAALNILLLLITIIGGRIVPAFTGNALRQAGQTPRPASRPLVERLLPPAMVAVLLVDGGGFGPATAGWLAAAVALLHGIRLAGWQGLRVTRQPIAWVLHLAYAWLPVGFALKAVALVSPAGTLPWANHWLHAFGIGVVATMILGVSTRAALGHTGRPLVVRSAVALAYGLITVAALLRVFLSSLWPGGYGTVLVLSGLCWTVAFGIFVGVYGPILTTPRVDGRPG